MYRKLTNYNLEDEFPVEETRYVAKIMFSVNLEGQY